MMELTGIDNTNRSYFEPLLFLGGSDPEEIQIPAGVIGDGSPAAAAVLGVDQRRKTGRIVSIYTRPDMRRQKAGTMLMEALFKLSGQYGLTRMECFFSGSMTGLKPFLEAQGFRTCERRKAEGYHMSDLLKKKRVRSILRRDLPVSVIDLKSTGRKQRNFLLQKLKEGDFGQLPDNLDEELSVVALNTDMPCAALLCSLEEGKKTRVKVQLLVSFANSPVVLMGLVVEWMNKLVDHFGTDADLSFYAANPKVLTLLERIAKPIDGQQLYYGEMSLQGVGL